MLFILTGCRIGENKRLWNCPRFGFSGYCLIMPLSSLPTSEFHGKFHAKNRYRVKPEGMSAISVFPRKSIVEFTS